jgi:hypothetical protein
MEPNCKIITRHRRHTTPTIKITSLHMMFSTPTITLAIIQCTSNTLLEAISMIGDVK